MNPVVLDYQFFREKAPFLKTKIGNWFLKRLFHWAEIDKVNEIHGNHCHLRGAEFTSAMLADPIMDMKYKVHNEKILSMLPQGSFITVSNHPIGSLDGIILIDIFARIRPDFKVMVNEILAHVSAMGDNFIPVVPRTGEDQDPNQRNVNGIRLSFEQLRNGHPMGFFPAGAVSFYNRKLKQVRDLSWAHNVIRLIRKASTPVYPVYFDFLNSKIFYQWGNINWKLRLLRLAKEAFNKKGQTVDVYLGQPIAPEIIKSYRDDTELADFLYKKTYEAKDTVTFAT
ncbi:MAG: lysophospholipid acyltransferase family protein [Tannerella sp.]|jgi:putative hemolysin|nr:lysophospholipid acyltransferase family protein [Tannerella sp.]